MQWTRNPVTEDLLNRLGIPFRYEESLPYKQLKIKESLKNNARITQPIVEEAALSYGMAMEAGATFPAIVVSKNGSGYRIHDGNNRMRGFDAAGLATSEATVGAYVLETDEESMLDLATRSFNRTNGVQQSREEAAHHAVKLLERFPQLSQAEVARRLGITQTLVSEEIRARDTAKLLLERRINPSSLSRSALCELSKLSHSEPALAVAADMAVSHELPLVEIREIVSATKQQRSDERRLEYLRKCDEELERRRARPVSRTGDRLKASYLRAVSLLMGIVAKNPTLEHLHITSKSERAECEEVWLRLRDKMDGLFA